MKSVVLADQLSRRAPSGQGKALPGEYVVGIDLGTTHTVLAYARLAMGAAQPDIRLFDVEQLVAPGEVAALPLLPSVRYHAAEGELDAGQLRLPWPTQVGLSPVVIGQYARLLGAQVPGRLVASAKSWLSHAAVDRLAPILPWGAPEGVLKVSPVEASASYLRHMRSAWNARFPDSPLERQNIVLTVPASFDEGARTLTLSAARQAGLPDVRLLEEPQAAFHDWLPRHRDRLAGEMAQTRLVLVCDVGGGTTDLSLIKVELRNGEPVLTRVGVGDHLMLGGDNMDLALAHRVENRMAAETATESAAPAKPLSASRLAQLMDRCRVAKETLLAADAPAQTVVTLLGEGARLVGGSRSVTLTRGEVGQLIVDGFFPQVDASAQARTERGGIVAFGLPYARDPAITRHIADFLRRHAAMPDALLLNGGVFRAGALAQRVQDTLAAWRGAPLRLLENGNPDVAVARGAVAHALAGRGLAPRIGGGTARSYFLRLDDARTGAGERGVCILARGSEPGEEVLLTDRTFALHVGRPVRFQLFSSVADADDQIPSRPGELAALGGNSFVRLPPLVMVLQGAAGAQAASRRDIPVQLATSLTEVGTLALHCVNLTDASQRWRLEFDLRQGDAAPNAASAPEDLGVAARLSEAIDRIDRIFGANKRQVDLKEVTQLRAQLERILGDRTHWPMPLLRKLFDALWQRARGRRRSACHERAWLNLAGFCLRPGCGDALDVWRLEQLWTLFPAGVQYGGDWQVCAEWWTLWRRVAGGLAAPEQLRLLDDFAFNLQINEEGMDEMDAVKPVKGSNDDMLRLGASLERIPSAYKIEIGDWLLGQVKRSQAKTKRGGNAAAVSASDSLHLWALGRIGAREPFYGSSHDVVPAKVAASWLEALLALDWKRIDAAAFAAVCLARVTDDRARDLPPALRDRIIARLKAVSAPAAWISMVREKTELDAVSERRALGEALPPGLTLLA